MSLQKENIIFRSAIGDDMFGVKALLERYHIKNLDTEQRGNGFVTTDITQEQLSELSATENGVTVAINERDDKVIGVLLGASWLFLKTWPMFDYMASILGNYTYYKKNISSETSYQYGPICIAEEYRSRGIGESLLAYQRQIFSSRYQVIVTFVNVLNPRSHAFHIRNDFEHVGFFDFNGNTYYMLAAHTVRQKRMA